MAVNGALSNLEVGGVNELGELSQSFRHVFGAQKVTHPFAKLAPFAKLFTPTAIRKV